MKKLQTIPWWSPEYEFFGNFYIKGDDSKAGYLVGKAQSLQERTEEEVSGIICLLSLKKGDVVLDCPCGYGRHSISLFEKGFLVTGSDLNSTHLARAIREAGEKRLDISFVQENMLQLGYNSQFDAVINMFYSFGFFETDEENETVLKNFYTALKPGGRFLMHTDVNVPRIFSKKYKEDEERVLASGGSLHIIDQYDATTKRVNGAWSLEEGGRMVTKAYSVRVYVKEEFEELCRKVGFSSVKTYSDWRGADYSQEAEDMMVVAIK